MSALAARCLILDDDPGVCRILARIVRQDCEPVVVMTAAEATILLSEPGSWRAFIIDAILPDGSGLDVLDAARRGHPVTPAMVLTGKVDPDVVNAAYDLDATCCVKPVNSERILHLLHLRSRPEVILSSWIDRYALSRAEGEVLLGIVLGSSKTAIAESRGSSELTVKKQISSALGKMGAGSLLSVVQRLLSETTE